MLTKIKHIMFIIIGSTIGTYLGNELFIWFDYNNNSGLYKLYSTPWHTKVMAISVIYGIIVIIEIAIQRIVFFKIKEDADND